MLPELTADVGLVDHHCHGVVVDDLDQERFAALGTECPWPRAAAKTPFWLAVRSVCAPVLGLPRHASAEAYVARRGELGGAEASRRLLAAAGLAHLLVETGVQTPAIASPSAMAGLTGLPAGTVVRLEALAERIAPHAEPATLLDDFEKALDEELRTAAGVKTVAAYRCGLDLAAAPPADADVRRAAENWLGEGGGKRLSDPVLISRFAWAAAERGTVIQAHVGFGDPDIDLARVDPSLLMPFLHATRTTGSRVALLHCYPYVGQAATLAHIFPHVWFDVSCVSHFAGPAAPRILRDALTVAPYDRVLFASDAYALAEQYLVSAVTWRRGLGRLLGEWVADDWLTADDARDVAGLIGAGNAAGLYRLEVAA